MLTAGPSDENCRFRRSKLAAVDAAETAENSCFPLPLLNLLPMMMGEGKRGCLWGGAPYENIGLVREKP